MYFSVANETTSYGKRRIYKAVLRQTKGPPHPALIMVNNRCLGNSRSWKASSRTLEAEVVFPAPNDPQ